MNPKQTISFWGKINKNKINLKTNSYNHKEISAPFKNEREIGGVTAFFYVLSPIVRTLTRKWVQVHSLPGPKQKCEPRSPTSSEVL